MTEATDRPGANQGQAGTAISPVNGARFAVAMRLPGVNAGPKTAARQSPVNGASGRAYHFGPHWLQGWREAATKSLAVVLTLAFGISAKAEEATPAPDAQARMIAPFLSPQTIAVGYVRTDALDPAAIWQQITGIQGRKPSVALEKPINDWVAGFKKAGGRELYVVLDLADLPQNAPEVIVPLAREADPQPLIDFLHGSEKKNGSIDGATTRCPVASSSWCVAGSNRR